MQNNPFEDEQPLTPTINPPSQTGGDLEGWSPYPNVPAQPIGGVWSWVILGVHTVLFILSGFVLFGDITTSNDLRLFVMGWGLVLIVHTVIVCLWDVVRNYNHQRRVKRAMRQAEVLEKRARMLQKLQKPE